MKNDDSFSKQIDDVLSGKYNRFDALKVCDTPRIFLDAGLQQLPILYTQNHLKDALHEKSADNPHWHGLSIEQIKKVPKLLESPVLLMDSLNNDDSIVAVLSLLDNDNAPVFATIKPNGNGIYNSHKTDSNFMLSIYGKEKGFEYYIKRAAEENKILYWNKEKSQEIQCAELLMAQGLDSLDSNKILHQTNSLVNKTTSTLIIDSNQAARIKAAREIKENMPNLSENERAAAIAILEAGAKSQRMSISEYMEKTFPDGIFGDIKKAENSAKQQGIEINGAVSINGFGENAKAVIYASKTADFSTWCHELSHVWQAQLTGELKQNAEEAFQVKNSDWQNSIYTFEDGHTDTSAEAFAYGFEDFLKHKAGEMATEDKKVIFEKFADYMSRTYNGVKQNIKINEKIAKVYEKFLQLDDNILAEAEKAVRLEIEQEQKINKIFNSPNLKTSQKVSETIGLVSDKFADLASRYGYDIKGYSHTIDNFFVSHALKQHGDKEAEEKRGNIAITHSDICNVFSVYTHPDYIIFGTKTKTGNHAIVYVKNIGDSTIFVEDVRSGKKELAAQTLYKKSGTIDVSSKKEAPELYAHSDPESVSIVDVKKEFVNESKNEFLQREIKIPRVESFQTRSHSNSNNITDAKNVNISFQPVDSSMLFQSAYHGSSANFDKFNTSEYGMSGDGAMAFGYGVYVSNSETIARSYAGIQGERNLYAVEIPDGDYIVWDKKISNSQKEKVKNELYENLIKEDYKGVEKQISAELDNVFSEELDGKNLYGTVSSYIGSDKETSRFFKNIGYSGIQYPAGTPENAINYVIFDDNDITIKEHFQFQIIGELGARELDRNAESNERIENLETAKKMEETKKDAKAIRLATGWEKGADGKWKYEIDDSKVHFNLYDAMEEWDERHPRYEELREKFFKTGLSEEEQKEFDQWIDERNEVSDKHTDMDFSEKLFGKTFKLPEVMRHNELFKAYPELKNVTVSIQRTGESGTLGNASYEAKHINLYRHEKDIGSFEEWEKKAGSVLLHEVQHIIQGTEGFAKGASPEMFEESPESSEQSNALDGKIVAGGKTFTSAMEAYRASAGEVESRNVQARMRFTPEHRINTLLSDTADIAPQDQIVMFDGPTSESRDIENTNEEHTVALKADSQENKMENTSSENISYENEEYWKTQFLNDNAETFKALDDFLNDGVKPKNDEFIFSKVPEILKASNVSENEIVIKTSIINKAKNEHNLSEQEIKDSIKNIASPVLIFDSDKNTTENKKNSFLSLTDTFAENGKPVAFSMNLDSEYERKNRFLKVNEIRSIHDRTLIAKNGTDLIQKWTKSGLCRYVDDKKISEWSKAAGVQFPLAVLQSDNFRIQQEDGFVNEILSFSKFADQQKNMEIEYQEYLKTVSPDFEEFWEEQTDTNVQNIEPSKTEFSNYDSQEYQQKKLTTQMILDHEDREQMEAISATMKSATKDVMDLNATPITEIPFTKENYDKLFPFGIVQTPVEKVKLGEHQFEKLDAKDRGRFLLASYQTLATPDIVIEEVKEGKHSHNYIKSFVFDEKTKTIQDIVVNIDGENISISAHPRNVNNVLNKIKTPDQLVYAAAEVGRMIEQRVQNELEIVNPTRADRLSTISVPLNKEYSMENALSTINAMENSTNATENSNPQYQTDEEFLQEYKQKYPESSLDISEDTKNDLENVFSQIDDYLDKGIVPQERRFTLPKVPSYLKELGSNETAISLPVSVIKKAKETHGLSNAEIKNSLTRLYDPVAVFDTDKTKSENKLDSKLILTDEFSESKPIALALNTNTQIQVEEDGHRKLIEVQDIRSIHDRTLTAKNGTDLVKHWTENGLCRYVDDKKISEWSTVARVSFPIEALHSDKNNILTKSEVVNSQNSDSVKQEENPSLQMEPGLIKKFNEMKKAIENRERQEGQTATEKTESAGSKKTENHEKPKVDLIKKAAKDFISAIKNGTAPFLNSTEKDFGKISLRPAAIVNAANGLPFSGEAQLLAQIYYQQQKMEGEIVTTFEGAKESGTFIANKPESKKNFVLANKTEQQQKEIIQKTRYFMPEACDEPDKIYAHALQKQRPQKISDYRDLIRHFENIPNGQKEISDLRIRIAHEHLKEIQSRFAMKKERILTVDEINERKKILQDYFKNLPEKHRESEKNAFENTFGLTLNPEEIFKTNLEGNFKNKKFEDVVKSNEKLTDQANRKLSSFIQKNSMEDKKLSEILHEEYNAQSKEEKETSKKLKIEAIGISEPETYLGKYLAACNANAEFVTDEDTIKAVQSNLVKKLEENYRVEKYGILKEIGQQAQRISNETTSKIAFDKAHSNKNTKEKKIEKEIGPIGMGN